MNSWCSCSDEYNSDILRTLHFGPRKDPKNRHYVMHDMAPDDEGQPRKKTLTPTPLFEAIKNHDWEAIVIFLRTGRWMSGFFHDNLAHMRNPGPSEQCKMWVHDEEDGVRQLPLHLAISAEAPVAVLECLLDLYPEAAQYANSSGKLPLELAVSVNTSDAAMLALLKAWPAAVPKAFSSVSYTPSDSTGDDDNGTQSLRNQYLGIILEQTKANFKKKKDVEWRKVVSEAALEVSEENDMATVLSTLLNYRKCLLLNQAAFTKWSTDKARKAPRNRRSRSRRTSRNRKAEI